MSDEGLTITREKLFFHAHRGSELDLFLSGIVFQGDGQIGKKDLMRILGKIAATLSGVTVLKSDHLEGGPHRHGRHKISKNDYYFNWE